MFKSTGRGRERETRRDRAGTDHPATARRPPGRRPHEAVEGVGGGVVGGEVDHEELVVVGREVQGFVGQAEGPGLGVGEAADAIGVGQAREGIHAAGEFGADGGGQLVDEGSGVRIGAAEFDESATHLLDQLHWWATALVAARGVPVPA